MQLRWRSSLALTSALLLAGFLSQAAVAEDRPAAFACRSPASRTRPASSRTTSISIRARACAITRAGRRPTTGTTASISALLSADGGEDAGRGSGVCRRDVKGTRDGVADISCAKAKAAGRQRTRMRQRRRHRSWRRLGNPVLPHAQGQRARHKGASRQARRSARRRRLFRHGRLRARAFDRAPQRQGRRSVSAGCRRRRMRSRCAEDRALGAGGRSGVSVQERRDHRRRLRRRAAGLNALEVDDRDVAPLTPIVTGAAVLWPLHQSAWQAIGSHRRIGAGGSTFRRD